MDGLALTWCNHSTPSTVVGCSGTRTDFDNDVGVNVRVVILQCLLVGLLVAACAPGHPVTDATCVSLCRHAVGEERVLVWSADPTARRLLMDWVRQAGAQVVDPVQVDEAMRRVLVTPSLDSDHLLRQVGGRLGADRILVASVLRDSHPLTIMYAGYKEGHARVTTVFDPTVTVRSFSVDRPVMDWTVSAKGPAPTFVLETAVADLTQVALHRVTCEADPASQWQDEKGCTSKS